MNTIVESPLLGLSQRIQPSNVQAEQALLGALLANNRAMEQCDGLRPEMFADAVNGLIFSAIRRRIEVGRPVDAVTLKAEFDGSDALEEVGGAPYLVQLLTSMIGIVNASEYARAIRDAWLRRQLIDIGETVVNSAFGTGQNEDFESIATNAVIRIDDLASDRSSDNGVSFAAAARAVVRQSEAAHRGDAGAARLDTGIPPIDALWCGLWPGQLYYLMARSRTGKTPAMLQIARHVARTLNAECDGGHVHIFSLEMSASDLLTVNLAGETNWTADQIKAGDIGDSQAWLTLDRAADALGNLPIHIDDSPDMDLDALRSRARTVWRKKKTRLICVDYRELIRRGRDQRTMGLPEWIPFLGYGLKALAKSLNVPVIALAQINKSRDNQESTKPILADLPYDGGQAADGVFALHRPELYMTDEPAGGAVGMTPEKRAIRNEQLQRDREAARGYAEFHALKRRFGPPGWCDLRFDGPRMKFSQI